MGNYSTVESKASSQQSSGKRCKPLYMWLSLFGVVLVAVALGVGVACGTGSCGNKATPAASTNAEIDEEPKVGDSSPTTESQMTPQCVAELEAAHSCMANLPCSTCVYTSYAAIFEGKDSVLCPDLEKELCMVTHRDCKCGDCTGVLEEYFVCAHTSCPPLDCSSALAGVSFSPTTAPTTAPTTEPTMAPTTLTPSQAPSTLSPSSSPTQNPTTLLPTTSPDIQVFLATVTNAPDALGDETSAESKAMNWLMNEDALQLGVESSNDRIRVEQRYALATFFFKSNETAWIDKTGWLDTNGLHECEWFGVDCEETELDDSIVKTVTEIKLSENNIGSKIPADFALLRSLVTLDLEDNIIEQDLTGFNWAALSSLQELILAGNEFFGNLEGLAGLENTNVKVLRLGDNNWKEGPIPSFVYNMPSLEELRLQRCNLIGRLDGTSEDSQLRGNSSDFSVLLESLRVLNLFDNFITGTIPDTFDSLSGIEEFDLRDNALSGTIPLSLGALENLRILRLGKNRMSGSIPASIGSMTNLRRLKLNDMIDPSDDSVGFTGPLPASLGDLVNLIEVDVSFNLLTGFLPTSLGQLENLEKIDFQVNKFVGFIPNEVSYWKETIEEVNFSHNQFNGSVPFGICGGPNLDKLIADCDLACSCCTDCNNQTSAL